MRACKHVISSSSFKSTIHNQTVVPKMPIINDDISRTQYADEWRLTQALDALREENERLRRQVHCSSRCSSISEGGDALENSCAGKTLDRFKLENIALREENDRLKEMMESGRVKFEELLSEYIVLDDTLQKAQEDYDALLEGKESERNDVEMKCEISYDSSSVTKKEKELTGYHECRDRSMLKTVHAHLHTIKKLTECPICLDYMEDTHISPDCLHRFCGNCIKTSLRKCNHECPSCRVHISTKRSLRADREFDEIVRQVVNLFEIIEEVQTSDGKGDFVLKKDQTPKDEAINLTSRKVVNLFETIEEVQTLDGKGDFVLKKDQTPKDEAINLTSREGVNLFETIEEVQTSDGQCDFVLKKDQTPKDEASFFNNKQLSNCVQSLKSPTTNQDKGVENASESDKDRHSRDAIGSNGDHQDASREQSAKRPKIDQAKTCSGKEQTQVEIPTKVHVQRSLLESPSKMSKAFLDSIVENVSDAGRRIAAKLVSAAVPRKQKRGDLVVVEKKCSAGSTSEATALPVPRAQKHGDSIEKKCSAGSTSEVTALESLNLPLSVSLPSSVDPKMLLQSSKAYQLLHQLTHEQMQAALSEFDEAIKNQEKMVVNRTEYLIGVLKRFSDVTFKECWSDSPVMANKLTPTVQDMLQKMVDSGFCTQAELDDDLCTRLRLLSERDAVLALEKLSRTPRERIKKFHSYAIDSLNSYVLSVLQGDQKQNAQNKDSSVESIDGKGPSSRLDDHHSGRYSIDSHDSYWSDRRHRDRRRRTSPDRYDRRRSRRDRSRSRSLERSRRSRGRGSSTRRRSHHSCEEDRQYLCYSHNKDAPTEMPKQHFSSTLPIKEPPLAVRIPTAPPPPPPPLLERNLGVATHFPAPSQLYTQQSAPTYQWQQQTKIGANHNHIGEAHQDATPGREAIFPGGPRPIHARSNREPYSQPVMAVTSTSNFNQRIPPTVPFNSYMKNNIMHNTSQGTTPISLGILGFADKTSRSLPKWPASSNPAPAPPIQRTDPRARQYPQYSQQQ